MQNNLLMNLLRPDCGDKVSAYTTFINAYNLTQTTLPIEDSDDSIDDISYESYDLSGSDDVYDYFHPVVIHIGAPDYEENNLTRPCTY